ncbi:MAG: 2-succinyl-5-enolpyruvyl-6-hydroxy-3-cyclohexene-1-carboxylic-acid synthase [Flavobacteriales bacterium]|nr:2-succinyl-5-enolpyruvyl-6-hydroxy-3-cyclohexene-1-carboxylic-acid synthase [Flavobacteriales bacterium]MDW8433118.1 2-succinyl-5-enolpyruvyl-6-hydroxy-3-cyclohexene-1-carboxylic-acid synthase [Flavobacteriales bacterium]
MADNQNNLVPLARLCAEFELKKVLLSPGARSAPLVRAFTEASGFEVRVVNDERAAAFMALGMAKADGKAPILICTSGSALLNYAPAVAEADGADIPILILSADRPKEFLGQFEGQTTFQDHIFKPWTRADLSLEGEDLSQRPAWVCSQIAQALRKLTSPPSGPVHINLHFREPLFEPPDFTVTVPRHPTMLGPSSDFQKGLDQLAGWLASGKRIMGLAGSRLGSALSTSSFVRWLLHQGIPVLAEPGAESLKHPLLLANAQDILNLDSENALRENVPEILLTWGGNIVSKNVKKFFTQYPPSCHIHIDAAGRAVNPFGCLSGIWAWDLNLTAKIESQPQEVDCFHVQPWVAQWREASLRALEKRKAALEALPFCDATAMRAVIGKIRPGAAAHVGNSMPVRYFYDMYALWDHAFHVDVNRGVSGIDGTLGTAVGLAWAQPETEVWCLLGDVSFHHGVNALWVEEVPSNLRVVVFNNGGGNIFGVIPGPSQTPHPRKYFENRMRSTARWDARKFGLNYFSAGDMHSLMDALAKLTGAKGAALLEIFTDPDINISAFQQLYTSLKP